MTMILKILEGLMNLCLLRGSPAVLPNSYAVFLLFILLVMALDVVSYMQVPHVNFLESFASTLLSRGVMLGIIYGLLAQKKLQGRYIRVVIAFLGTMLLLSVLSDLIETLIPQEAAAVLAVVLLFWMILVGGYVLKLALDLKMITGLLLTFGLYFAATLSTALIIGEQIKAQLPINPGE